MRNGPANTSLLALLSIAVALLAFLVFEVNHVEHRLIVQGEQIQALGEATEKLAASGVRLASAGAAGAVLADDAPAHVLHPDVPNFLKPRKDYVAPPGAAVDGVLFRGWPSGDPKGFNALIDNSAELGELIESYIATPFASRDPWENPDDFYGELATRIEITDDYKEFTMYLRHGMKWQTPSGVDLNDPKFAWLKGDHEVTAKDFVFTFDMMTSPQVENGFLKNYYAELESYKAVDDYTFVIRWKKKQYTNVSFSVEIAPLPEFVFAYDSDGTRFPKETVGARLNQHWYNNKGDIGAGAYSMASYEPGARIRLVRNENYPFAKPAIAAISYPIYTDPNQTLLKLKAHELSIGALTAGQYREEILQYKDAPKKPAGSPFFDGRISCQITDQPVFSYIGWNADKPLFADKRVRRAMTFAFDRKRILDSVFVGLGAITTGPYLHSSPYYDPSITPIPFDLEQAKKLLSDAGWTDTDGDGLVDKQLRPGDAKRSPFEFTLLVYGSSKEYASLANIFKEDLLKIGVKMNVDAAEWSLMQKRMDEKTFDAYTGAWGLPWEMDLYQIFHSSQADVPKGSNRVGFRNKEADRIIEQLRVTFDHDERVKLAHEFDHIVDDEQPYSFFIVRKGEYCWWNDVKNVKFAKLSPIVNTSPWWVAKGGD